MSELDPKLSRRVSQLAARETQNTNLVGKGLPAELRACRDSLLDEHENSAERAVDELGKLADSAADVGPVCSVAHEHEKGEHGTDAERQRLQEHRVDEKAGQRGHHPRARLDIVEVRAGDDADPGRQEQDDEQDDVQSEHDDASLDAKSEPRAQHVRAPRFLVAAAFAVAALQRPYSSHKLVRDARDDFEHGRYGVVAVEEIALRAAHCGGQRRREHPQHQRQHGLLGQQHQRDAGAVKGGRLDEPASAKVLAVNGSAEQDQREHDPVPRRQLKCEVRNHGDDEPADGGSGCKLRISVAEGRDVHGRGADGRHARPDHREQHERQHDGELRRRRPVPTRRRLVLDRRELRFAVAAVRDHHRNRRGLHGACNRRRCERRRVRLTRMRRAVLDVEAALVVSHPRSRRLRRHVDRRPGPSQLAQVARRGQGEGLGCRDANRDAGRARERLRRPHASVSQRVRALQSLTTRDRGAIEVVVAGMVVAGGFGGMLQFRLVVRLDVAAAEAAIARAQVLG
mmetsp:Transcript_3365/g.12214  ORF Transcript_3365/g.12214 Transcript_3365/m.12214 type:complete len:513 (-) Transcript_3365:347-1885(-)